MYSERIIYVYPYDLNEIDKDRYIFSHSIHMGNSAQFRRVCMCVRACVHACVIACFHM